MPVSQDARKDGRIFHTGTGRFAIIDMLPMSHYESGYSTGEVSLRELFHAPDKIRGINRLNLEDIAYLVCRGGWPYSVVADLSRKAALSQAMDYIDLVVEEDISRVDNTARNVVRACLILRSYARFQAPTQDILPILQ